MIGRLNHVAIAVPDLIEAAAQYKQMLGASVGEPQDEPDHGRGGPAAVVDPRARRGGFG